MRGFRFRSSRILSLRPKTRRPAADKASRRMGEKTTGTYGSNRFTPSQFSVSQRLRFQSWSLHFCDQAKGTVRNLEAYYCSVTKEGLDSML